MDPNSEEYKPARLIIQDHAKHQEVYVKQAAKLHHLMENRPETADQYNMKRQAYLDYLVIIKSAFN
jgi:hypothetical protein